MGGIRKDFGRITLESRRESFIIHPDYGYCPKRIARRDLVPGEWFRYLRPPYGQNAYKVLSIDEEYGRTDQFSFSRDDVPVIPCDVVGTPLSEELDPESGSFGKHWRELPHPEFSLEDLPDLIAALEELRDNPR